MPDGSWSVHDAKNRFSALIKAAAKAPQTVTKHGKPAVVVIDAQAYARLTADRKGKPKDFVEHLLAMPQDDEPIARLTVRPRDLDL